MRSVPSDIPVFMASLSRVRLAWTGFFGGPGVSTFYTNDPDVFLPALNTWVGHFKNLVPDMTTLTIEPIGDVITSTTGVLEGSWTHASIAGTAASDGNTYSAPVGWAVNWDTATILAGRRLRGRTFLVPLGSDAFQDDGQVKYDYRNTQQGFVDDFIDDCAGSFLIWHRNSPGGSNGGYGTVVTGQISTKAAVLRSRRD